MSDPQRREFLAAGIASLAALAGTQPAAGSEFHEQRSGPDACGQGSTDFQKFPDRDVFIAGKDGAG